MKRVRTVRLAGNFERNLEGIQAFLEEDGRGGAFRELLRDLETTLLPNLERFPDLGRDFLTRTPRSAETSRALEKLMHRLAGRRIREYLFGDFLVLYLDDGLSLYLLTIRHHRQLSYDLPSHWD